MATHFAPQQRESQGTLWLQQGPGRCYLAHFSAQPHWPNYVPPLGQTLSDALT